MAFRNSPSSGMPRDTFPSFSFYLSPLSGSESASLSMEYVTLNTMNSSTRNLKIRLVLHFESLFWLEEYFPDRLFFPIDALKFYPLPFSFVLFRAKSLQRHTSF